MTLKILYVVLPVFCIIGLGYLFAHFKKLILEPVIEILLYLTIPALVISSLSKKQFAAHDLVVVGFAALVVVIGTGIVSYIYLTIIKRKDLRGFYLPAMFMNSGNMSFPLAILAFGPDGLAIAVLYYIAISFLVYSLGIYIAKGSGGFAEMFKLPLIYASSIGIALNLADVRLPEPFISTVDILGAAAIPINADSPWVQAPLHELASPAISIAGALIRIIGGVAIAYIVVTLLGIEGLNRKIIVLSSAMPSAVINFVVSHRYKLNSELVASIVAVSTLISIITTPIVLMWIME